jgi:hypothetical protein
MICTPSVRASEVNRKANLHTGVAGIVVVSCHAGAAVPETIFLHHTCVLAQSASREGGGIVPTRTNSIIMGACEDNIHDIGCCIDCTCRHIVSHRRAVVGDEFAATKTTSTVRSHYTSIFLLNECFAEFSKIITFRRVSTGSEGQHFRVYKPAAVDSVILGIPKPASQQWFGWLGSALVLRRLFKMILRLHDGRKPE